MTFNSLSFAIFFALVTSAYFLLAPRFRPWLLVAASCYFYIYWNAWLILVIIFATGIDYVTARRIERESRPHVRKAWLLVSLVSNLGILGLFKYYNFFVGSLNAMLSWGHVPSPIPLLNIILPIGISFHTFQALSYTIDVYRGVTQTEKNYGIYLLYVVFYPQLVSGPIERSNHFLPQLRQAYDFDGERVTRGLRLMLWGLFKKVVIADRLALYVNMAYAAPQEYAGYPLLLATLFFAFQIYCDFSGYTDIAIGAAKVMGYDLIKNFDRPYFARSIPEFWHRWHVSLSTWFRDYVYKPLGGSHVAAGRWCWNVMVVFVLSGLWHGANWTYVVWGALHGLYMIGYRAAGWMKERLALPSLPGVAAGLINFALVCAGWIFFRARTLPDAWFITTHLVGAPSDVAAWPENLGLSLGLIGLLLGVQALQGRVTLDAFLEARPVAMRWACYVTALLTILFFGVDASIQFIYFQF